MDIKFTLKNNEQIMLRADRLNYELCHRRKRIDKATGKESEDWEGFNWFGSLEMALNKVLVLKMRASDAKSLQELKADLLEFRADIKCFWGPK